MKIEILEEDHGSEQHTKAGRNWSGARSNTPLIEGRPTVFQKKMDLEEINHQQVTYKARGEIHWTQRRGARFGRGPQGGSPRGAQRAGCCAAAFGIARQSDADRATRGVGGHLRRSPRS